MGDRANVAILDHDAQDENGHNPGVVVLYTHWGGTELPDCVHAALVKRERWDDPAYLARIVFCQMVIGGCENAAEIAVAVKETTGLGISTGLCDNEYPILVLDTRTQRIASRREDDYRRAVLAPEGVTVEEYCRLPQEGVRLFRAQGRQAQCQSCHPNAYPGAGQCVKDAGHDGPHQDGMGTRVWE